MKVIGNKFTKILCVMVLICTMAFIFYMSSQTKSESSQSSSVFVNLVTQIFEIEKSDLIVKIVRKCAHMFEYATLGMGAVALLFHYMMTDKRRIFLSFGFCAFYAVTDEIHQLFVKGRACRVSDVFIDSAGSVIGIFAVYLIIRLLLKHRRKKQ